MNEDVKLHAGELWSCAEENCGVKIRVESGCGCGSCAMKAPSCCCGHAMAKVDEDAAE